MTGWNLIKFSLLLSHCLHLCVSNAKKSSGFPKDFDAREWAEWSQRMKETSKEYIDAEENTVHCECCIAICVLCYVNRVVLCCIAFSVLFCVSLRSACCFVLHCVQRVVLCYIALCVLCCITFCMLCVFCCIALCVMFCIVLCVLC